MNSILILYDLTHADRESPLQASLPTKWRANNQTLWADKFKSGGRAAVERLRK